MYDFLNDALYNLKSFFIDFWGMLIGVCVSILGYFIPIKDLVHMVILFFIIEMILGYFANKAKGKATNTVVMFSLTIVYNKTIPRMFITVLILIMLYLWDTISKQTFVPTYTVMGWFFSGLLILKSTRHAFVLTKWFGFKYAGILITNRIKKEVNNFITEEEDKENG